MVDTIDTGKPKTCNTRSRSWVFTINNYSIEELEELKEYFLSDTKTQFVLGEEVGKNETPHIQGCVKFKNARTFEQMKKLIKRAHIEVCKNYNASAKYCKKDNKFTENLKIESAEDQYNEFVKKRFENVVWKDWQQTVLCLLETKPDYRKVYWFWSSKGGVGKSMIAQYIDWKYDAIIANGKQADILHQYATFMEKKNMQPTVAIIDIPRSHKEYVCYSTMEKIKDGLVYSGKYEGSKLRLIPHHLIIFANFEPDYEKMSEDRWNVTNVDVT